MPIEPKTLASLTAEIAAAYFCNNSVAVSDVAAVIQSAFSTLQSLEQPKAEPKEVKRKGAVSIRSSVKADHILSMIDGKPYKMLKRHLTLNGYTPESYREIFGLPKNYPMVAAIYAEKRRELAVKIGLGNLPRKVEVATPKPTKPPRAKKLSIKTAV